ncbi:MAG TPA: S8 family serine peptidase [Thermomonas sp.]|nr:S8 family serine peptidase [Thermomonas sp.]
MPPTTPGNNGLDFTPTVANDGSLTQVNPPAIQNWGAPVTLTDPAINRHLSLTNATGALGAGLKGQGVTIGFLDSGVNRNHPTLSGRVARSFINICETPACGNDLSVDDKIGHGTVVASLAAGRPAPGLYSGGETGNWGGGIAQDATIVSSRIISDAPPDDDGSGEGNEIGAGQGYGPSFLELHRELADAGAKIINNSWGGLYWDDPALTTELATAYKDFVVNRGGIVVFANGNAGEDPRFRTQPSDNARLPTLANDAVLEKGWLTVGALDPSTLYPERLTDYSQQCGPAMNYCLVAPGNVVFIDPDATTAANSGLYQGGGTSYAAPLVSGAAAVVWSAFPYFSNDQVRQAILGSATDLGAAGVDPVFGWGLLNVTRAASGPSNFAWGDFSVSFTGHSVWRTSITGSGGLIKAGSGILTLAQPVTYTGDTRVLAGGLDIRAGLQSNLIVSNGATVWAKGIIFGNVSNSGLFLNGADNSTVIANSASYTQAATGNLGVWLGSHLRVGGVANINGQVSVLGVKSGYTTTARETLLNATGGVNGTFASLRAAPNVFLDASLAYDPNNVFLNINRINVASAVAGMSLSTITQASAARVESAMGAIDGQLAGNVPVGIGSAFIDAAGALQQASSVAHADRSLRSLSGELHGASAALTLDAIDAGRRALNGRLDTLSHAPRAAGGWYRDLSSGGTLAQGGFDSVGIDASGEMIGNDWRVGSNAIVGIAMNRLDQSSWLGEFGDRSRGHQRELQVYASAWRGDWYGQAQLASGTFQRQMQRNLMLGAMQDAVATQLSGDYVGAFGEIGRRFEAGGIALTPYVGSQYVQIANDGFDEGGASGFGLRANAWDSSRWQGFVGLRATRGWRVGDIDLRADARAEWQRTLSASGFAFDASYGGVSQWAPLQGIGLADRVGLVGAGVAANLGTRATFRFDLSRRSSPVGDDDLAWLQAFWRF